MLMANYSGKLEDRKWWFPARRMEDLVKSYAKVTDWLKVSMLLFFDEITSIGVGKTSCRKGHAYIPVL